MPLSPTDYLLWVASGILLVVTAGLLIRRKLVRELPVFSLYALFHVLRFFTLFLVKHGMGYNEYFYSYWIAQTISIVLGFGVLYELYCKLFANYDAIQQLGGILFAVAGIVLLIAATITALYSSGADTPGVIKELLLLERSVRVMQCGLVLFLFLASFYFGLPWQSPLFGIALGFGVFASIELAAVAVRSQVGAAANSGLSQINSAAYGSGVMIWLCYLLAPQPALQYAGVVQHADLEKWNQALREILER